MLWFNSSELNTDYAKAPLRVIFSHPTPFSAPAGLGSMAFFVQM